MLRMDGYQNRPARVCFGAVPKAPLPASLGLEHWELHSAKSALALEGRVNDQRSCQELSVQSSGLSNHEAICAVQPKLAAGGRPSAVWGVQHGKGGRFTCFHQPKDAMHVGLWDFQDAAQGRVPGRRVECWS